MEGWGGEVTEGKALRVCVPGEHSEALHTSALSLSQAGCGRCTRGVVGIRSRRDLEDLTRWTW